MRIIKHLLIMFLSMSLCAPISLAQASQNEQGRNAVVQDVQIIIGQEQIRFTSQKAVQEMQLQVFNQAGEQIFDSGVSYGPTVDWPLQNPDGQPLRSGLYAYTLTVKEQGAENARVRKGHFIVDRAKDREGADKLWVTSQNDSGIGSELTVARGQNETIAGATAPPRQSKQMLAGGLEPKRVTETEGIKNYSINAGLPNQIAKFMSANSIGPSAMSEVNGNVGIGMTPTYKLDAAGPIRAVRETSNDLVVQTTGGTNAWAKFWMLTPSQAWSMGSSQNYNGNQFYLFDETFKQSRMTIQPNGGEISFPSPVSNHIAVRTMGGTNAWAQLRMQTNNQTWGIGTSQNYNGDQLYFFDATRNLSRMVIATNGNVGMGTTNPLANLHVEGTGFVELGIHSRNERAILALGNTIGPSRYVWTVESGVRGQAGVFGIYNRVVNRSGLEIDGNLTVSVRSLRIDNGADFSENFDINAASLSTKGPKSDAMAGMVVTIDPANPGKLALSNRAYDKRVAGIISGAGGVKPGMIMGQEGTLADGKHPVALTGRVYAWVDASYGAVKPGDLLTTSMTPGHAMKVKNGARAQGAILGKAMTELKEGKGLVLVLVTLQ